MKEIKKLYSGIILTGIDLASLPILNYLQHFANVYRRPLDMLHNNRFAKSF
jgi:hypothetical protein